MVGQNRQNPKANRRSFAAVSSFGAQRNAGGMGVAQWVDMSHLKMVIYNHLYVYIYIIYICTYIYIYSIYMYIYIHTVNIYIYVRDPCQATFLLEIDRFKKKRCCS